MCPIRSSFSLVYPSVQSQWRRLYGVHMPGAQKQAMVIAEMFPRPGNLISHIDGEQQVLYRVPTFFTSADSACNRN